MMQTGRVTFRLNTRTKIQKQKNFEFYLPNKMSLRLYNEKQEKTKLNITSMRSAVQQ